MEQKLDHRTRKVIYNYIQENPGVPFPTLMHVLDLNKGTLRYHLNYLRKNDRIYSTKENGHKCYFCAESGKSKTSKYAGRVLDLIKDGDGLTRKELSELSGMDRKTLTAAIKELKQKHLICQRKEYGEVCYEPITRAQLKQKMYRLLVKKLADGDIDEATFLELEGQLNSMTSDQ